MTTPPRHRALAAGDRVRVKGDGWPEGTIVSIDDHGDPSVKIDGDHVTWHTTLENLERIIPDTHYVPALPAPFWKEA